MSLRRREFLAVAGAGATLLLAGCSDSGENLDTPAAGSTATETTTTFVDPVPSLDITDFKPTAADDGSLVIEVTVENVGDASGSATLRVTATAGDESDTKEQSISLDAGAKETYSFQFGFDRSALTGFDPRLVSESDS